MENLKIIRLREEIQTKGKIIIYSLWFHLCVNGTKSMIKGGSVIVRGWESEWVLNGPEETF